MGASYAVLGAALLMGALALPLAGSGVTEARPAVRWQGVNLASGEFASEKIPGVHGRDYIYPSAAVAAPFRQMGMNSVRVPILWERIQRRPMGPLDEVEMRLIDASLDGMIGFDQVVLDVHNYARYRDKVLTADVGSAALADLWTRLAGRYGGRPKVAFGLMNEPHGLPAAQWRTIADRSLKAIRATGARNLVLVPGVRWSGGHSWFEGGTDSNAEVMAGLTDPAGNLAIEIHQYLDSDSSGTGQGCSGPRVGRERLERVTHWLRQQRARGVLAEFGGDRSATCLDALEDLTRFLDENGDVWIGWHAWAGGEWWGTYPLGLQPEGKIDKPQAAVLRRHLAVRRGH